MAAPPALSMQNLCMPAKPLLYSAPSRIHTIQSYRLCKRFALQEEITAMLITRKVASGQCAKRQRFLTVEESCI
jgi:hypothetical protein